MLQTSESLSFFKNLVRIPSLSHEEKEIADYVEAYINRNNLRAQRHDDNVYVTLGTGSPHLLLNSHLDVVPPSAEHPYPPFGATEVDGCIYGRGTVDAKASGSAMLRALIELNNNGWRPEKGSVTVALTTCEEVGGDYNGLQQLRLHLPTLDAALVGEPTEMQPCVGQKGLLILRAHAKGQTAHAARAHLGKNAIYAAARDALKIEEFEFEKADTHLGKPTITATLVEGGTAKNVVPDVCTLTLDIRSTPAYTHEELIELIDSQLESEIEVYSKRLIPTSTDPEERIVKACLAALPNAKTFGSPTTSDWVFLNDIPTVKIGPGPSQRSHTPHEHIEIDTLLHGVRGYKSIIKAYFKNTIPL
ncbi:MAG: M20/M25/M40 family metallo-hydrolase [Rhodothermaceae bacterium]|nr:M20/M25/M40 family metallo-hydrolase [Rhodothermaceae bacterium]